jgi:hypothetical protein
MAVFARSLASPQIARKVAVMRIARFICLFLVAVELLVLLAFPVRSPGQATVGISVRIGPPVLPIYVQPICPEPGYIWVPGYWAYGPDGYFWVPGTWVEPPEVGVLWTPGYWEWEDNLYVWHDGYWGPEVGYYGGINYGFGYTGVGFFGGYWREGAFYYNRAVTNVDVTVVRNTYNTAVNTTTVNHVSFNGGPGGTTARPTSREMAATRQQHVPMTPEQTQHQQVAGTNRTLLASVNHGRPDVSASIRPGQFNGHSAADSGGPVGSDRSIENPREKSVPGNPDSNNGRNNEGNPPSLKLPNTPAANPALEQKRQQELDRLSQQQAQERQRLEQKYQQEQQKLPQHAVDDRKQQEIQGKQQQQLQQLEQKHQQQQQQLQQKQQREEQKKQKPEGSQSNSEQSQGDKSPHN